VSLVLLLLTAGNWKNVIMLPPSFVPF